jgi:pimeloyl-ACP methyl ester carboxylesterase
MEPLYFGKSQRMFGIYYPAQGVPLGHAMLIAGPLLNENIRAQFVLKQIAERCAAKGFDVLRFDYSGLGNSPDRTAEATLDMWVADIVEAAQELTALSGSRTKAVVAVRFSANLVSALTDHCTIERLVLWDPLLTGAQWLELLLEERDNLPSRLREQVSGDNSQFSGHEVGEGFVDALRSREFVPPTAGEVSAVLSRDYRYRGVLETLTQSIEEVESDCVWQGNTGSVLYPTDVVNAVCSRLL